MIEDLKELIYQLECSHLKPSVRTSQKELSNILADDYFEFGSSGNAYKREDYSGEAPLTPERLLISDFEMNQLSKDAVMTTYKINNETRKQKSLRSSVWRFRNGKWQLFFHQGTKSESF